MKKKKQNQDYRKYPLPEWFSSVKPGTCRWCNRDIYNDLGLKNIKRKWHKECWNEFLFYTRPSVTKKAVKKRDRGICASCGIKCRLRSEWNLDHIKPLALANGDKSYWQMQNLQSLCCKCHSMKSAKEKRLRSRNKNR